MSVSFDPKFIKFSAGVADFLTADLSTITFSWDQLPVGSNQITVDSNATWTCAFDGNAYFTVDISGGTGDDTVTVSCIVNNNLGVDIVDYLRFFINAVEYDSVTITQTLEP